MSRMLAMIGQRATLLLPFALLLGIVFQALASSMKPLVTPLVIALLALALVRTDHRDLVAALWRPWRALAVVLVAMVILPIAMAPVIDSLPISNGLAFALFLMACCPPLTSMPAVAGFLGLDRAQAMLIVVAGTLLMPLSAPPLALLLLGLDLQLDMASMMLRLALVIGGGVALSVLLRWSLRRRMTEAAPVIDGVNVVILLLFAIPIMDGVGQHLQTARWRTLGFVLWASALTAAFIAVMTLAFWQFGRRFALTAAYGGGSRNNALLLAVLPATVDPDYFLFIAAVQVPIYTLPSLMHPLCRHLLRA